MDLVVRQGEGTTKSFSAANLLEVVDRGFTVTGGATGVVWTESVECHFVLVHMFCFIFATITIFKTLKSKSVEYFTSQPQHNS